MNGVELLSKTDMLDLGLVDITELLATGSNTLGFVDTNVSGGWTYGFNVLIDGANAFHAECGTVGVYSCENNDYSKTGVVCDQSFSFSFL